VGETARVIVVGARHRPDATAVPDYTTRTGLASCRAATTPDVWSRAGLR
jgi:hypothetical protein